MFRKQTIDPGLSLHLPFGNDSTPMAINFLDEFGCQFGKGPRHHCAREIKSSPQSASEWLLLSDTYSE